MTGLQASTRIMSYHGTATIRRRVEQPGRRRVHASECCRPLRAAAG